MAQAYSFKDYNKENMARAIGRSMPISFKQAIEICNFIRGKDINFTKKALNNVIKEKQAIPFKRFNRDMGHKKRMAAGRYPKKASKEILDLINLVEANAQFKGLSTSNLIIKHISANKAATTIRFGRKRNRKAKRTNIEIVVHENVQNKKSEKVAEIKGAKRDEKESREKKTNARKKSEESAEKLKEEKTQK